MNLYKYKGKRIRASDKNLVYRFCVGTLLLLFVAVLLLLNMGQLMRTDWEHFSLLDKSLSQILCKVQTRVKQILAGSVFAPCFFNITEVRQKSKP